MERHTAWKKRTSDDDQCDRVQCRGSQSRASLMGADESLTNATAIVVWCHLGEQ